MHGVLLHNTLWATKKHNVFKEIKVVEGNPSLSAIIQGTAWGGFDTIKDDAMTIKSRKTDTISAFQIERHILLIRGEKVLLDADLAALYEVETKVLIQAVKRNIERFPTDFMFQLSKEEFGHLRSQFVTSSWGGRRYPPYVFTEQGVAMLSTVLRSERAIRVNIEIMRAFVRLRKLLASNKALQQQLDDLEQKYDTQFKIVFDAIRELMAPSKPARKRSIGFIWDEENKN